MSEIDINVAKLLPIIRNKFPSLAGKNGVKNIITLVRERDGQASRI
jgi:hypothetical protein